MKAEVVKPLMQLGWRVYAHVGPTISNEFHHSYNLIYLYA